MSSVRLDIEGSTAKLNANVAEATRNLEGIAKSYEHIQDSSKKAAKASITGQEEMTKSTKATNTQIDLQKKSVKNLETYLVRLEKGQKKTNNPALVKKYNIEIARTKAALVKVKTAGAAAMQGVNSGVGKSIGLFGVLKTSIGSALLPLLAGAAVFQGLKGFVGLVNTFEDGAADLSASTGVVGDNLEFLKQAAVEAGIETTKSAVETIEAYKLIASVKPELLDNAEALVKFTDDTITLAEAMKSDLPTAATYLTGIMNKLGEEYTSSEILINAMAAGAKEGSSDLKDLADSMTGAGTEIKASNVSVEESISLFETMTKTGTAAGTDLSNIMKKLSATEMLSKDAVDRLKYAGVDMETLSDKSLSFTDRLRALKPIQGDINTLVSVFGEQSKTTAQELIGNVNHIDALTKSITSTSEVQKRANLITETSSGAYARLKNTIQSLLLKSGGDLDSFLVKIINYFRSLVLNIASVITVLATLPKFIKDNSVAFKALGLAVLVWNSQMILAAANSLRLAAIQKGRLLITSAVTIAQNLLNAAMTANPIGLVIKAVALLIAGFGILYSKSQTVRAGISGLGKVASEVFKIIVEAFGSFRDGFKALARGDFSGAFKSFKTGLIKSNPIGIALTEGNRLAQAFNKGFKDKIDSELTKKEAENLLAKSNSLSIKTRTEIEEDPVLPVKKKLAKKDNVDIEKLKLDAMKNGLKKQLALEDFRYKDLLEKLDKYGVDSTEATEQHELNKFEIKTKFLKSIADLDQISGEERIAFIYNQTVAEIDAIESALATAAGGALTDEQFKQINLLRRNASEKYLSALQEFQDKELQAEQQHEIALLELKSGEFKTLAEFEEAKQKDILDIKLKYAEKQLAIIEKLKGAESSQALKLRGLINSLKGDLEGLEPIGKREKFSLYSLIGLDPNDPEGAAAIEALDNTIGTTLGFIDEINEARIESQDAKIKESEEAEKLIDKNISEKQKEIEVEKSLSDKGLSNNLSNKQRELDALKQQKEAEKIEQKKALEEKKKIQREQFFIDSITQGSSLITTSTQLLQSVAALPFGAGAIVGPILVAGIIASFLSSKAKIYQSIKAEKGKSGTIRGEYHNNGGVRFTDQIEVENGEDWGVLSRSASSKFGNTFRSFVDMANNNESREKIAGLFDFNLTPNLALTLQKKEDKIILNSNKKEYSFAKAELKENNRLLKLILEKENTTTTYSEGRKIIISGNKTRIES